VSQYRSQSQSHWPAPLPQVSTHFHARGSTTIVARNGTAQPVHVSVQSWGIAGQNGASHEILLRGFYVAHLLSGQLSATIDGQTTEHLPGDYWTVKAAATMQVKVVGEVTALETTIVGKQ
jgi:hypothetical protein